MEYTRLGLKKKMNVGDSIIATKGFGNKEFRKKTKGIKGVIIAVDPIYPYAGVDFGKENPFLHIRKWWMGFKTFRVVHAE